MTASEALLKIQEIMSGNEWGSHTMQDICDVMVEAGYEIADTD